MSLLWVFFFGFFSEAESLWETLTPTVVEFSGAAPSLELHVAQGSDTVAEYGVNSGGRFGIGLGNEDYGLSLFAYGPPEEETKAIKGSTRYTDYQFRFNFLEAHSLELIYQTYSGYYLKSSTLSGLTPIRPDIQTAISKIQHIYVFHPKKLRLGHLLNRIPFEEANGGSWFFQSGLGNYRMSLEEALVAGHGTGHVGDIRDVNATNIEAGMGYGYHWARKPYYAGGLIRFSAGWQSRNVQFSTSQESGTGWTFNGGAVVALGLDYPGWFFNITVVNKTTGFDFANQSKLTFVTGHFLVKVGWRL